MANHSLWIALLAVLQFSSAFCGNNSSQDKQHGDYEIDYHRITTYNSNRGLATSMGPIIACSVLVFVIIVVCILFRCILRCRRQQRYSGLILSNDRQERATEIQAEQQVNVQHYPSTHEENLQQFQTQTQPQQPFPPQNLPRQQFFPQNPVMQQFSPQNHPMKQFPEDRQPMQQFSPHNHPMQQFWPDNQPTQQFPPNGHPMQQFPPQYQPMQQFPAQHQPMQQFPAQHQPMQQLPAQHQPMQQFPAQHQPMQQFPAQHQPMPQQFQWSPTEVLTQSQQSPTVQQFYNPPEPPPSYDGVLPPKY